VNVLAALATGDYVARIEGGSIMLSIVFSLLLIFAAAGDDGNGFDPHGGVRATRCGDEGNGLDPHGGPCTAGLTTDEGNGFDPHG
jgi:hypothetical protein